MLITSKSNAQIKEYMLLKKSKKERYKASKFVVEGAKVCQEAYKSEFEVLAVYFTKTAIEKYNDLSEINVGDKIIIPYFYEID